MTKNYKISKEIKEQPVITRKIVKKHVKGKKVIFPEFKQVSKDLLKIKRFIFLGCGSSYHAALFGNLVFEEVTKLNCEAEFADEFNKRNPVIEKNTAVVALSQSGETKEVVKALKLVKKKALIISLTNNKNSKVAKMSNVHISLDAGKETAVPATKTFTSQLLQLVLLAIYIKQIDSKDVKKIINDLAKLPKSIQAVIAKEKEIKTLAQKLKDKKDIIILGNKYNYPIALESALKLKEAANVFAEGMATAEFEHGPKALNDLQIIKISKNKIEVNNKKILSIEGTNEILNSVLLILPFQLLAYHLALLNNINPDRPKKIKKFIK